MNLNEMPTPETDALVPTQGNKQTMLQYIEVLETHARDLERRLAVARVALDKLARLGNEPRFGYSDGNIIAFNALAQTAPKP